MLYYFATEGMIQTNNADLGKAFPGGMEDMVPGKASFFDFYRLAIHCVGVCFPWRIAGAIAIGSNHFR